MRKILAVAVLMFASCGMSLAWNCTGNDIRVQVPAGTKGTGTGDAPGNVVTVQGLTFECEMPPSTTTSPSSTLATSNATATGGNASATGGNSSSKSSISNSGNSSNTNTLSNTIANTNTQKQGQTQSNASTNSNQSSATGNGDNSDNSVTNVEAPKIPVNTAVAPPVFSTANCFKGISGGAQTAVAGLSFGGGGIDKNCAALITAQALYAVGSREGACRVIVSTKSAKAAGVTLEICLASLSKPAMVPPVEPIAPVIVTVQSPPQIVYVPEYIPAPKTVAHSTVKKKTIVHKCTNPQATEK